MIWILFIITLNDNGLYEVTQQPGHYVTESQCVEAAPQENFICLEKG